MDIFCFLLESIALESVCVCVCVCVVLQTCNISGVAAAAAMVGLDPLGVPPPLVVCAGEDEDVADTIMSSSSSST